MLSNGGGTAENTEECRGGTEEAQRRYGGDVAEIRRKDEANSGTIIERYGESKEQ